MTEEEVKDIMFYLLTHTHIKFDYNEIYLGNKLKCRGYGMKKSDYIKEYIHKEFHNLMNKLYNSDEIKTIITDKRLE